MREVSIIKVLCINIIGGIFVVYVFGILVQAFVMDISVWETVKVSVVFLPGDCIKAIIAAILVTKLHRSLETYYYACSKEKQIYKCGIRKRRNTFVACFLFIILERKDVSYGYYKEYKKHRLLQPNKIAIKENDRVLTYKEWFESVYKVANWLNEKESKNKTIAIVLENRIEFLELFAGAAMAGWVCVPLDIRWKQDELKERIAISNPDMIVTEQYKLNDLLDEEERVIEIDRWKQIIENYLPTEHIVESLQDAPFYMGFTSGSTGKAKAFYVRNNRGFIVLIVIYMIFIWKRRLYFNSWNARSLSFSYTVQ